MTCHEPHGLVVEAYRTDGRWHVHVVACPDLTPREQLSAATAISDAITDTRRTLIAELAERN